MLFVLPAKETGMTPLLALWLPILLSAVAVFIVSAVAWMALPHHHQDHDSLPDEAGMIEHLRRLNLPPGNYGIPHAKTKERMQDPEVQRCWKEGPLGFLNIIRTPVNMGRNMGLTFLTFLITSTLIGYLASVTMVPGTPALRVFQAIATAGILTYSFAFIPNDIWFGRKPRATWMCILDGIAYGLITGAIFAVLWPAK